MKLKTEKTLMQIVDAYSSGMSYNASFKQAGIKPRTGWSWIAASRDGTDDSLMVEMFGQRVTLERALVMGRRALALEARSKFEASIFKGYKETVVTFQGAVQYVVDVRTVGWTPDEREAFGFRRDGYAENERGEVIPLTVRESVPVAATIRMLATFFEEYQETSNVRSQITNLTQGATNPPKMVGPPIIPPRPALPQLEVLPDVSEASGLALADPDLADLLGPEPEPEPSVRTEDEPEPPLPVPPSKADPGPVIATPPPPEYAPAPTSRPISAALAGLLRR